MDMPMAMSLDEIKKELGVETIKDRLVHIEPSSAKEGYGINEGISWLSELLQKKRLKK
eukprot:CAMPEP_0202964528 /NCGR_PEP_ID=MMETSP1396-20130829/8609_1 /ASSEMBLY_ACC=CAM_ASM_000872 /TAXON_ID= /ORGANISM="Pseudokeronopsis sp., Strain Brazil" /LENGTH=57 /DNA_ID=CAMNT_0049686695 /DNA_START=367 /DNA_END=540 /DNA_ORIENTATION=-